MGVKTTALALTTTPSVLISSGSTWANIDGAGLYDNVPFILFNDNSIRIRVAGTSSTAETGFPVLSSAYFDATLMRSEALWGFTTAGSATVVVIAGRQVGG